MLVPSVGTTQYGIALSWLFLMNGAPSTNSSDAIQNIVSSGELRNVVRCSAHRSDGVKLR